MQQIKRLGVFSVAKVAGITYGAISLLFIPIFLVAGVAGAFAGGQRESAGVAMALAVVFAFVFPVIYGGMGFLLGGLMAFAYNLAAAKFGGIELELSNSAATALSPSSGAAM